jgi:hypothetical protein
VAGFAQSVSEPHAVLQPVAGTQMYAPHATGAPGVHVPEPLQVPWGVKLPPLHDDALPHVPPEGYTHAPAPSQSVAPHVPPVVHADVQQWVPVPLAPHFPLVHWSPDEHAPPAACFATHVPLGPGFRQKAAGSSQSVSPPHAVLHAVTLAQMKPPAHGAGEPVLHAPEPSQVPPAVSMPFAHAGWPHERPGAGYLHAPAESQPLAPHVPPVVHAAAQQLPAPVVPQTPLAHAPAAEHGWPEERRHCVPPTHVVFGAHPVLGAVHDVPHVVAVAQANPFGHAAGLVVVQPLPPQTLAGVSDAPVHEATGQAAQVRPFEPQALFAEPGRQVPPSGLEQQPPAQSTVVEHVVRQVWFVVSQATLRAQSVPALHPHDPPNPPADGTHAVPALSPAQL